MEHRKGKEKVIYAVDMYCGVIYVHKDRTGSRKAIFPAAVSTDTKIQNNTTVSEMQIFLNSLAVWVFVFF